jgi:thiol-disulfide isomerase/thioredoxin
VTPGAWTLLASVLLALGVGGWRAYADGRFRGTRTVKGAAGVSRLAALAGQPPQQPLAGQPPQQPGAAQPPQPTPLLPADRLGERATLLQFSSAFCAPCRATRRTLSEVAAAVPGVAHVEIDAEQHLGLVRRVNVLRTPTTLVLDAAGHEVTRAAGAPRKEQVLAALSHVLA